MLKTFITETGQRILNVHNSGDCSGSHCPIHNPSAHYLDMAPRHYNDDKRLMERICEHGIHHPDPDALDHIARNAGDEVAAEAKIHSCDGCCTLPPPYAVKLSTERDRLSALALK